MIAHDTRITDLLVAERQFVVGEANGPRVVGELRMLQRARVQRDRPGLLAARESDATVEPPERREPRIAQRLTDSIGRPAERGSGLGEIVLEQPRFREGGANRDLIPAAQGAGTELRRQ